MSAKPSCRCRTSLKLKRAVGRAIEHPRGRMAGSPVLLVLSAALLGGLLPRVLPPAPPAVPVAERAPEALEREARRLDLARDLIFSEPECPECPEFECPTCTWTFALPGLALAFGAGVLAGGSCALCCCATAGAGWWAGRRTSIPSRPLLPLLARRHDGRPQSSFTSLPWTQ